MNKSLKLLLGANGVFVLAGALLGPLYAVYVEGIDRAIMAVSLSWGVYLLATTAGNYAMYRWGDRIRETEYLLILGYWLRALGWLMYILVQDLPQLMAVQAVIGLGEAAGTPAFDTLFARHLDKGKQVADYSEWKLWSNLTQAGAAILGGWIVTRWGFEVLFIVMAGLALLAGGLVLVQPRKRL